MRLATLNLMHGRSSRDGRVDIGRFRDTVAQLDADVLALQEVDRNQPRSDGLDLAAEAATVMGGQYRFAPALYGTPGQRWRPATGRRPDSGTQPEYGIALISRLPVDAWWSWHLAAAPVRSPVVVLSRAGRGARVVLLRDEPRAVLAARLDSPFGYVTVATTHLSFVPGWNAMQVRRVAALLGRLPGPRVLAGDLNLPGRLPAMIAGWRRLAAVCTYPAHQPRLQLDHVLGDRDGGLTAHRAYTVESGGSDHLALVVEFTDSPSAVP